MTKLTQPSQHARDWLPNSVANGRLALTDLKAGGFGFDWIPAPGDVRYLLVQYSRQITASKLTARFTTTAAPEVRFIPTDGDGTGHAHLVLLRQDWLLGHADDRWYSNPATVELKAGTFTLEAALTASDWTNMEGQSDPAKFALALASPAFLGLTFGGVSEFGHGVGVTGAARFELNSFQLA